MYRGENPVETFLHVNIREAQFQEPVLLTVEFDGQAGVEAAEVRDETCNRDLSAKLEATEAAIAQLRPQKFFGRGLANTQMSRECREAVGHAEEFLRAALTKQPLTPSFGPTLSR